MKNAILFSGVCLALVVALTNTQAEEKAKRSPRSSVLWLIKKSKSQRLFPSLTGKRRRTFAATTARRNSKRTHRSFRQKPTISSSRQARQSRSSARSLVVTWIQARRSRSAESRSHSAAENAKAKLKLQRVTISSHSHSPIKPLTRVSRSQRRPRSKR